MKKKTSGGKGNKISFTFIKFLMRIICKKSVSPRRQPGRVRIGFVLSGRPFRTADQDSAQPAGDHGLNVNITHISSASFFIRLSGCSNVFLHSYLHVPCPMFLLRRVKTGVFTLIELLMRKSCKSGCRCRRASCPDSGIPLDIRLRCGQRYIRHPGVSMCSNILIYPECPDVPDRSSLDCRLHSCRQP